MSLLALWDVGGVGNRVGGSYVLGCGAFSGGRGVLRWDGICFVVEDYCFAEGVECWWGEESVGSGAGGGRAGRLCTGLWGV